MPKHTSGPWKYNPETGDIFHTDGDVEPAIAIVLFETALDQEQNLADGLLIAAAPEMLAALRACAEEFGAMADKLGPRGLIDFSDDMRLARSRVEELIARVEG